MMNELGYFLKSVRHHHVNFLTKKMSDKDIRKYSAGFRAATLAVDKVEAPGEVALMILAKKLTGREASTTSRRVEAAVGPPRWKTVLFLSVHPPSSRRSMPS